MADEYTHTEIMVAIAELRRDVHSMSAVVRDQETRIRVLELFRAKLLGICLAASAGGALLGELLGKLL